MRESQPIDPVNGRKLCTPDQPMHVYVRGERWAHTNAREIADLGETRQIRCEDCGAEWTEELPQ